MGLDESPLFASLANERERHAQWLPSLLHQRACLIHWRRSAAWCAMQLPVLSTKSMISSKDCLPNRNLEGRWRSFPAFLFLKLRLAPLV